MRRILLASLIFLSMCHPAYADVSDWDTTAANNDDSDLASGIDWAEGMAPSQVNNSARSMMAEIAQWYAAFAVPIATVSGDFTVDTSTLKVVSSSNQVTMGSGETSFGGLLNLDSDYDGSNIPQISLQDGISTLWHLSANETNSNFYLTYGVAPGTAALRATSSGDILVPSGSLGIGTTTPGELLVVTGGNALIKAAASATSDGILYFGGDGTNYGAMLDYDSVSDLLQIGASHTTGHLNIASTGGIYTSGATGGSQGADTINAKGFYIDGVAIGNGSGDLVSTNNLSDLASASTARTNLGLGGLATLSAVGSTEITDNAVALADMEHGTSGDILYYGASGTPSRLTAGTDGQVLTLASGVPSWATSSGGGWTLLGTTSLSSTSHSFTGLPSSAVEIKIVLHSFSADAGDDMIVQLGDSGGLETSGYTGRVRTFSGGSNYSTGVSVTNGAGGIETHNGVLTCTKVAGNTWLCDGQVMTEGGGGHFTDGSKATSGTTDRIGLLWAGGSTFDSGTATVYYQ